MQDYNLEKSFMKETVVEHVRPRELGCGEPSSAMGALLARNPVTAEPFDTINITFLTWTVSPFV